MRILPLRWWMVLAVGVMLLTTPLDVAAFPAEPDQDGPPAPTLYEVILPAADAAARTALVQQGIAIEGLSGENAVSVMTASELAALRRAGWQPLAVTPLDFPPADAAYHNYMELAAVLADAVAHYPDLVHLTSIGTSLEGRAILAVKVSDHPQTDEPDEPAVFFAALHHAREHLTVEMALAILRLFTEGYGHDPVLTNLVEQREIWILPNVNPDGGEYDIASGQYRYWRKNRRLNADDSRGVDLNRNYGYRWGCCDGASSYPYSDLYQGPEAFSEPETQAVRDFVIARTNISTAISFHTYGELILYPYGYTYEQLPEDMQPDDYRAFVALAGSMAATNGYTPQQASSLYITSGDTVDWLYGNRGVFGFTVEMYPTSWDPGFYPSGSIIAQETERNLPAVIYLSGMADNPRKGIGLGGDVTPPQVTIQASAGPDGQVTLNAEATDDVGVTLVAWQADGVTIALDRDAPFIATWTPPGDGAFRLTALAFDAGANMGMDETWVTLGAPPLPTYLPLLMAGE